MKPPLVVRDGRHPFEVLVMLFGALIGGAGLLGPGFRSNAIESAWGGPASAVWYVSLLGFALFGLWAVNTTHLVDPARLAQPLDRAPGPLLRRLQRATQRSFRRLTHAVLARRVLSQALQLERVAMYGFGYALIAYPPAAIAATGGAGTTAAIMFLGLGVATAVRIRHIHIDLRKIERADEFAAPADPVVADPDTAA